MLCIHTIYFLCRVPKREYAELSGNADKDYDACLICQHGADRNSRPMQKLTSQGYPALIYAITNRKDGISFKLQNEVDPQAQTFWKRIRSVSHGIAPYTNRNNCDER